MKKAILIISYIILCIAVSAAADASFIDDKILGHILSAAGKLLFVSGAFLFDLRRKDWIAYVVTLIAFNIVSFDYIFNLFAGLPWDFHGSTSNWDLFLSKQPEGGIIFGRAVFLLFGISVPIIYLKAKEF